MIHGVPVNLDDPSVFTPTPWEAYTYDGNDNARRTHPAESQVYRHHHNTPSGILIDGLGRTITAVERNRAKLPEPSDPLPAVDEYRILSTHDIQGNVLTVTDALGRVAFTHIYDLAKRPLKIHSIDAGNRWMVPNAAGVEIERRDSKDALTLRAFDKLNRATFVWARNGGGAPALTLREQLVYGEDLASGLTAAEIAKGNLLGKLYQYYDEAGLLTLAALDGNNKLTSAYDFKGNPLEKRRQVVADSEIVTALHTGADLANTFVVNWNSPPPLEGELHSSIAYDALNRVKSMEYPEDVEGKRNVLRPYYNRAAMLERVVLNSETYIERIAYNAKGQRTLIAYGNGVMTRHAYDTHTFRLVRMRTEEFTQLMPGTYQPNGRLFQDFAYEYDLVGNILRITDVTPGCGARNNPEALQFPALRSEISFGDALVRRFAYDPLYRLISAAGRESKNIPSPRPWEDTPREGLGWGIAGTPSPDNARDVTQIYMEAYEYDPASNMLSLNHTGAWTRRFGMAGFTPKQWQDNISAFLAGGSPVWGTQGNRLTNFGTAENQAQSHTFDSNGNLARENANRHFRWDYADRMIAFADRATPASPASKEAIYLYDPGGQRIKKLGRRQTGEVETTTYVDGLFEYHRWSEPGKTIEHNTLHVMDNQSRIAMVRLGDAFQADGASNVSVNYQLGDHLGNSSIVLGGATAAGAMFINREEFFPYGETSFGSFGRKRYRYTGQGRDEESGLNYHGARYYNCGLQRWTSCDRIGLFGGINLYGYARSNPLRWLDPTGEADEPSQAEEYAGMSHPDLHAHTAEAHIPNVASAMKQATKAAATIKSQSGAVLSGTYNLWSGGAKAESEAAAAPGFAEAKTAQGGRARAMVEDWVKSGKYPPDVIDNPRGLSPEDFKQAWIKSSGELSMRAPLSDTPVTDLHPTVRGWVKTNHELPRIAGFGCISAGMSLLSAASNAYNATSVKNETVQSVGLGGASVESTGALLYGAGSLVPEASLMATGASMMRYGGGAATFAVSGYFLIEDYEKGDVVAGVGDAAGTVAGATTLIGSTPVAGVAGAFAIGYAGGSLLNTYAVGPLIDKAAPGSGALGDWYYRNVLR